MQQSKAIHINGNYPIKGADLSPYSFENEEVDLEDVVKNFVGNIRKEELDGVIVGSSPEHIDIQNQYRTVRVLSLYQNPYYSAGIGTGMHKTAMDIIFRRINGTLTIESKLFAYSQLKYLKNILNGAIVALLFSAFFWFYLKCGAFDAILLEYVQSSLKSGEEVKIIAEQLKLSGWDIWDIIFGYNAKYPPNIQAIVSTCWMTCIFIFGISGGIVYKLLPNAFYTVICRALNQPTFWEFESFVTSRRGWVQQILSNTLDEEGFENRFLM